MSTLVPRKITAYDIKSKDFVQVLYWQLYKAITKFELCFRAFIFLLLFYFLFFWKALVVLLKTTISLALSEVRPCTLQIAI